MKFKRILTFGVPLISSFLVKHQHAKQPQSEPQLVELASIYAGNWHFTDTQTNRKHRLTITDELTIHIDGTGLEGHIISLNTSELVFLDHYGYQLRITADSNGPQTIFDEAENTTYPILNSHH